MPFFLFRLDWSRIACPLPIRLFEKYTHQSIAAPLSALGIDEIIWCQCRTFALDLAWRGFVDPISLLYTSFKRHYTSDVTFHWFNRWLMLNESNRKEFIPYTKSNTSLYSTTDLISATRACAPVDDMHFVQPLPHLEQIWFLFSISILVPANGYSLTPDVILLDTRAPRAKSVKKRLRSSRFHCLFAITPSGRYSNQLCVCKSEKDYRINASSKSYTRIVETDSGVISSEHVQQWLEDFLAMPATKDR